MKGVRTETGVAHRRCLWANGWLSDQLWLQVISGLSLEFFRSSIADNVSSSQT